MQIYKKFCNIQNKNHPFSFCTPQLYITKNKSYTAMLTSDKHPTKEVCYMRINKQKYKYYLNKII